MITITVRIAVTVTVVIVFVVLNMKCQASKLYPKPLTLNPKPVRFFFFLGGGGSGFSSFVFGSMFGGGVLGCRGVVVQGLRFRLYDGFRASVGFAGDFELYVLGFRG